MGTNVSDFYRDYIDTDHKFMNFIHFPYPRSHVQSTFREGETVIGDSFPDVVATQTFATGTKKCISFRFFRHRVERIIMTSPMNEYLYFLQFDTKLKMLRLFLISPTVA